MRTLVIILTSLLILTLIQVQAEIAGDTLSETNARAKKRFYIPHYFPLQYAGNIGVISAGVGYQAPKDRYQLSVVYGFSPASVTGANIHTLTGKNIFHLYRFPIGEQNALIPYTALGLSIELGGRSFFIQPDNMPKGYYDFPKSIHVIASAGLKFRCMTENIRGLQGVEFFAETCTVDAYIWYKFLSSEVKIHDIFTLAFGVHFMRK